MNYTTEIVSVDIETVSFVVKYIPEDTELSPITLNIAFNFMPIEEELDEFGEPVYKTPADVPFAKNLEYSKHSRAPIYQWNRQRQMLDNYSMFV